MNVTIAVLNVLHRVGYGGNCNGHFSAGCKLNCKKVFNGKNPAALDIAYCLAKEWLVRGTEIPAGLANGRTRHVWDLQRDKLQVRPHAALDAEALRFM